MTKILLLDKSKMPLNDGILSWIYYFTSPYKKALSGFFVYRFFRYTYFAVLPAIISIYVDKLQNGEFKEHTSYYISLGIGYLLGYGIMLSNSWVFKRELVLTECCSRSLALLGLSILHSMPISWHVNQATGKKLELIMDARKGLFELLRIFRWQIMPIFGSLIGISISLIYFKGPFYFAILFFLFTFLYLLSSWYFNRPITKLYENYKDSHSKLISRLYEFSSSILTVKSFGLEQYIEKRAEKLEQISQDSKNHIYTVIFTRWFVVNSIASIFLFLFCIVAVNASFENKITAGAAGGIVMLYYALWVTLEGISVQQDQIYDFITAIRRFIRLCREESNLPLSDKTKLKIDEWKNISFLDLSFSYNKENALKNVNLTINKGEIIALVGPSGAGKSTIIKLILGLYSPEKGEVRIDSNLLSDIDTSSWLKKIAFVPQDIELFDGSIRENILLDQSEDNNILYQEILKKTCLNELLESLEEKDLTIIGERGLKLSGGQKQRIGLARALLRDPEFLILDEATSALDSITENHIQDALFQNLQDKTLLIIAHRLSTVRNAHKIIVLNDGQIDDFGSFNELLKREGLFSRMWGIQGLTNL